MASVALHPLASRSGAQSSTIVSVDVQPDKTPTLSSSAPQMHESDHTSLFGSSTTDRASSPHPFTTDDDDLNRIQFDNGIEWGLHHTDIDKYPILDPQYMNEQPSTSNSPPIRAMTAAQFEEVQRQYVELDVPHSVVFPFLHGVDGDNQAQCAFFHAPMTGQPTPRYRGMTIVRADMPQQRKRTSSSASKLSMMSSQQNHRSRAGSLISSNFSADSTSSDEEDDFDVEDDLALIDHTPAIPASNSISSGSSAASESHASSLFSFAGSEVTMNTQVDSDSLKATEAAANHARELRQRKRSLRNSNAPNACSRSPPMIEAQPSHSFLVSSVHPNDIINPPLIANLVNNSLEVARQCQVVQDERCVVKGATFIRPRQADGISLRNFKTQCAKYSTISDIIVYCPAGIHEGALNLANWIRQAQETCYRDRIERGLGSLRYNVFVITDSFDVFERDFPHLVSIDESGFSRQRVDFVDREREEMQRFTEASEIDENVFMGCTANVPFAVDEYEGSSLSLDSYLPHEVNPHAFSVCIETAEHGELPSQGRLAHASYYLDAFEASTLHDLSEYNADSDDGEDTERPSLGPTGWTPAQARSDYQKRESQQHQNQQQVLCPAPSNIVHLRGLGSGSTFEDEDAEQDAIDDVVNMISWIYKQAMPPTKNSSPSSSFWRPRQGTYANGERHQQQMPRRILLHCSDGYTDSSILGLAYLMYARNLTLAEAYLDLQSRCNRCFFVYARDVPFLQKLEKRFAAMEHHAKAAAAEKQRSSWGYSEERQASRKASAGVTGHKRDQSETAASVLEQSVWARGLAAATGLMSGVNPSVGSSMNGKRSTEMTRTNTPIPRRSTPTPQSPHREIRKDHSWFTNPHFQGSFPSRILPFLYLGNLSHAMNPGMLHALGITHVVSVGESALIPPSLEENLENAAKAHKRNSSSASAISNRMGSNTLRTSKRRSSLSPHDHRSLWEEERMGRITVLDLKGVSDDGIDSLRPHMNRAVEFIEQARLEGGKVLVHCRVGVSRSATVCIGYVMAHCDLSMIESFLLVRSRRMNVLTQPTLLFVWELRGFEAHLTKLKRQRALSSKRNSVPRQHHHDDDEMMNDADDAFSLAALSLSSGDMSHDQNFYRKFSFRSASEPVRAEQQTSLQDLASRQSIFFDEDLKVEIGAGAGSVYGFQVRNTIGKPFNSGSLTRLDHRSAKLTHGCFCKLLSELNQRYMVN